MTLINLTPHALVVRLDTGDVTIPPSGQVARVDVRNIPVAPVEGIPATTAVYGEVTGVPAPEPDVAYIVSMPVGQRLAGQRNDIYGPDSGPTAIRENGQIVAVRGLIKY